MNLNFVSAHSKTDEIGKLFKAYTDMLVEGSPEFKNYLNLQNYDEELQHLEDKYGEPEGRLYVGYLDGVLCGCIALRKMDSENCELKRFYIKPEFRGKGLSKVFLDKIIDDAKDIGYKAMYLDTLPFLETAIGLYKKKGFEEIESYNGSPMDNLVYLKLEL
ncbi:MAG: GNAT family N-acetyltransferase [Firmicutes bacterium]|nr:GNAT family N-acetyltransferase [Bacillota bacterium]